MSVRDSSPTTLSAHPEKTGPDEETTTHIGGNAPREIKEAAVRWFGYFRGLQNSFGSSVKRPARIVDVSTIPGILQDPTLGQPQTETRVTFEITVTQDMLNGHGIMDQGCMLWLIDECSATALAAQSFVGGQGEGSGVSQTMNVTFHSPAALGTRLRIINTTMGTTVKECQSEMWDQDNQRLVVKGMQIMMQPQPGKQYIWRPTPIVP